MSKKSGGKSLAPDFRHGNPLVLRLDPIEAASKALFDPRRVNRIRGGREPLREQFQFFGAKAFASAFTSRKFGWRRYLLNSGHTCKTFFPCLCYSD
jgi:hypothetical protein